MVSLLNNLYQLPRS